MDRARLRRYEQKLRHAEERLEAVAAWLDEAEGDLKSRLAVYKAFQEACESVADLAAMLVADTGTLPKDDYSNLSAVGKALPGAERLLRQLKEATGLRNRLVHEYNGVDDPVALERIGALAPALREFLGEVHGWTSSHK